MLSRGPAIKRKRPYEVQKRCESKTLCTKTDPVRVEQYVRVCELAGDN